MEWTSTGSSIGISVWGRGVGVGTGGAGLEDEGLVEIQKIDGKKVYHLTDAGREELARHEEDVERIWRRAHGWKDWGTHPGPEMAEIGDLGKLGVTSQRQVPLFPRRAGHRSRRPRRPTGPPP